MKRASKHGSGASNVFHGTLDEFETDDKFDLVFMSHVIEHVLDPVATVAKIRTLLKPGGVLYLETPNVRSLDARLWRRRWGSFTTHATCTCSIGPLFGGCSSPQGSWTSAWPRS